MRTAIVFLLLAGRVLAADPVDAVNPLIGTKKSAIGYGGTMPFVSPPFAMTNWTAQTRQNRISVTSYEYGDTKITGFVGTHQPAIWMGDYGYVTVVPQTGELRVKPEERGMTFSHAEEVARADSYAVTLHMADGASIRTEMTATERCVIFRFRFAGRGTPRVLVEASRPGVPGQVATDAATGEISGSNPDRMDAHLGPLKLPNFSGYFVAQFRRAPKLMKTYDAGYRGAYAEFAPGEVLEMRVGTSFLSVEQARANLEQEIPGWNFDEVRAKLHAAWLDRLNRLEMEGAAERERTRLYTALYHALLYPRVFSEYGRYYSAFDDRVHAGESYTAFSIWDTFRAENSLLTLFAPDRIGGMVRALLQNFQEGGWMPKWPNPSYTNIMIATHADSLVAEAIRKKFKGFDYELAWQAVYKDAMTPPDEDTKRRWVDREERTPYEAREGLTWYKQLGYVPTDKTDEAASNTLEGSYDDWCVAQVAKAVGREDDFRFFLTRSLNGRKLFNPAVGLMNGRTSAGAWAPLGGAEDTNERRAVSGWTEGDAWVYTWSMLHDQAGLIRLMNGREKYAAKLDEHFRGAHNIHSNEPSHHYAYLYDFAGEPWKTQKKVREIAASEYGYDEGGLDGDDDCGQMSAWLLFSAMGFYPVNPTSGEYMIGSPMVSRISLRLANGKRFTVEAAGVSSSNVYVQSASIDGKPLTVPVITWEQIQSGATVRFRMGPRPSRWGSQWRPREVEEELRR